MNGVIYCRVSSKEQTEGTSLESQEVACREYASTKHINIEKVFVERGESAKFADRTQLLDLLEFVRSRKGQVQALLVWKVDRFARNVSDHFSIKAALLKYGVRVISVTEPIDANPEGNLMETILAGFAQFDNDIRASRTVQGMRRRIQEGISPWAPPLGYRSADFRGQKKTLPDTPDQPLFGLLQRAWKEAATGAHTKAQIRRLMASWGVLTRRGKPLSAQSVDSFFRIRFYAGLLVDPWSGEEFQGKHVPMVTEEEFARVQQVFAGRRRPVPHQAVRKEFPLRGLIRCGTCQRYLTGSFSRGRSGRYPYYRCFNRECSDPTSYPIAPVHEEFESFLDRASPNPELFDKMTAVLIRVAEDRHSLRKKTNTQRADALRRVKREEEESIRMRAQGLISDEEFMSYRTALRARKSAFLIEKSDELNAVEIGRHINEIKQPMRDLRLTWRGLPPPRRLRFQRLLLPAGYANQSVGTADLGLLFKVFGQSVGIDSGLVPLVSERWNQLLVEIRTFAGLFRPGDDDQEVPTKPLRRNPANVTPGENLEPGVAA